MSLTDLIPAQYRLAAQIAGAVILCAALMAGYYWLMSYHEDIGFQRATASCNADKLVAEQAASQREVEYQTQIRKANHDAEERQAALAADIDALNRQLVRVRNDRDAMRARVAELSADAARRVADTCIQVHGECTERYSELAKETGRIVSDCQTLIDGWPK